VHRPDAQRERDELRAATDARLAAVEETRTALRIRAERAEADLDTARAETQQLTERLAQATADPDEDPDDLTAAYHHGRAAARKQRRRARHPPPKRRPVRRQARSHHAGGPLCA
jgi:hypothetical protein